MTMFMDGFHFSLLGEESSMCLNYLFDSWFLNQRSKFHFAMFVSFLFAIVAEALSAARGVVLRRFQKPSWKRSVLLTVVYGFQALVGYVIMFIAMMYSVEMLLSVAVGLACGNALFMRLDDGEDSPEDEASTRISRHEALSRGNSSLHEELSAQSGGSDDMSHEHSS